MSVLPRQADASRATWTRGVVFIHATPKALCAHIQWALESVLLSRVSLDWRDQPASAGLMRADLSWTGAPGTGAAIASALKAFNGIRYEITEDASPGTDGARWCYTPSLGILHTRTSANGDIVLSEDRLREIISLAAGSAEAMSEMIEECLGADHDAELDIFRHAGEGAPVRWLHKVG
jgi:hypothetical protein